MNFGSLRSIRVGLHEIVEVRVPVGIVIGSSEGDNDIISLTIVSNKAEGAVKPVTDQGYIRNSRKGETSRTACPTLHSLRVTERGCRIIQNLFA